MLRVVVCFSALQRAEIAEIYHRCVPAAAQSAGFSALQRAEIAEIFSRSALSGASTSVSVLFNEPKLLKFYRKFTAFRRLQGFSALQRAEIAEIRCGRVQR